MIAEDWEEVGGEEAEGRGNTESGTSKRGEVGSVILTWIRVAGLNCVNEGPDEGEVAY